MKRPLPYHPLLAALFPVLALYARNMSLLPYGTVLRPALIVVGVTAVIWLAVGLAVRDAWRGATAASAFVILCFTYGAVIDVLVVPMHFSGEASARATLLPYWIAVTVVLLTLAAWRWRRIDTITRFLNVGALTLFALNAVSIVSGALEIRKSVQGLAPPETANAADLKAGQRPPDIFYIILDGYGRSDALQRFLDFSNKEFIDGLEKRGFYVAKKAHSNYCQTELSLSSSLNMDYLQNLLPRVDPASTDRAPFEALIARNRVAAFLKGKGYTYMAVTTGFPGVRTPQADIVFTAYQGPNLLESSLLGRTPMKEPESAITSEYAFRRDGILKAFDTLEQLGVQAAKPRFVFAHILAPHPPFVLGPDGELKKPHLPFGLWDASAFRSVGGTAQDYVTGYRDQATYIQKRVLQAVDRILATAKQRPIIMIQGDHGSKLLMDQELLKKTEVKECFRNLNTYLVPDSIKEQLYPEITPVNSFRLVFNELFDANQPKLADRSYFSPYGNPQAFTDVTDRIEDPVKPAAPDHAEAAGR